VTQKFLRYGVVSKAKAESLIISLTSLTTEMSWVMASTSQPQQYDFSNVPAGAIREVHRQGEICLQSIVQLALAADQQATTLTGILGAASVALLVATAAMISNIHPNGRLFAPPRARQCSYSSGRCSVLGRRSQLIFLSPAMNRSV
jgi:hypothetical protein